MSKKKITTEYEGVYKETGLEEILDFLHTVFEIANTSEDFVRKVTHGVTDETSQLSATDQETLREWYFSEHLKTSEP